MTYHNTTGVTGETLKKYRQKAKAQDAIALEFFIQRHNGLYTACDVWKKTGRDTLLTSMRRSINTLMREGFVIKTSMKAEGIYGRQCFLWKLNPEVLTAMDNQLELNL